MTAVEEPAALPALPTLSDQVDRLVELGVHEIADLPEETLRAAVERWGGDRTDALVVIDPRLAPPSAITPLLRRKGKPGFVVEDMIDADEFTPYDLDLPETPVYLVHGPDRGDDLRNWRPDEALPAIVSKHRTPLLQTEAIHWVLQRPEVLERGHCFMTIGSRLVKPGGRFDSRTPALWISNGSGRDGRENREAPKLGWCWWGNRHTWLGFASADRRTAAASAA